MKETDVYLIISTLLLGVRHGVDWDHVAAIFDLTGAGAVNQINADGSITAPGLLRRGGAGAALNSIKLSTLYALGHALVVMIVGGTIRCFAAALPAWFDSFMERVVGGTLLLFGIWIVAIAISSFVTKRKAVIETRAALLGSAIERIACKFTKRTDDTGSKPSGLRQLPAFIIGMIHGLGAETSTRIVLIASVAAASSIALVGALLISFTAGLIFASAAIAISAAIGFVGAATIRPLYVALSILTSVFSIYVGGCLLCGYETGLPALALPLPDFAPSLKGKGG